MAVGFAPGEGKHSAQIKPFGAPSMIMLNDYQPAPKADRSPRNTKRSSRRVNVAQVASWADRAGQTASRAAALLRLPLLGCGNCGEEQRPACR